MIYGSTRASYRAAHHGPIEWRRTVHPVHVVYVDPHAHHRTARRGSYPTRTAISFILSPYAYPATQRAFNIPFPFPRCLPLSNMRSTFLLST